MPLPRLALLIAASAVAASLAASAAGSGATSSIISFVDVGQGDAVVMRIGDDLIVSDAGQLDLDHVDAALRRLGGTTTIDIAILSHPHSDHVRNFADLVEKRHWKVKLVVLGHSDYWHANPTNRRVLKDLQASGAKLRYVVAGERFDWGGGDWEILNPVEGKFTDQYSAANASVAYRLRVHRKTFLFTGDIGAQVAERVAATWTQEDLGRVAVYLATHHGSAEGSNAELLAATRPQWAVLSTGKNGFHHPTAAAIGRLEGSGASIWCTDANGTITATVSPRGRLTWTADRQPQPWWAARTKAETGKCVGH